MLMIFVQIKKEWIDMIAHGLIHLPLFLLFQGLYSFIYPYILLH
jgi:hypothetical protein